MFVLGLTGSIGMGKSTTAKMFADEGCEVWDADAAVHRLYDVGGAAVPAIANTFPDAVVQGAVSRSELKKIIAKDPKALKKIEMIVHPLVAEDRAQFLEQTQSDIAVLDIPLLFETGGDAQMDAVVCVFVSDDIQRCRVLERGTMTLAQFEGIKAKQMPASEKITLADYVIETDTLDHAREQVLAVVKDIRGKLPDA